MALDSLRELLLDELKDLYSAEQQLVAALPKMAQAADSSDLKEAITGHLRETKGHVRRLEQAFQLMGEKAEKKTCEAMKGLLEEGEEVIDEEGEPAVKDAALICAAQKVEHYEIASYGTARTFAQQLELPEVAQLMQATLDEEGAADKKLTEIAESNVNAAADRADDESEAEAKKDGEEDSERSAGRGRSGAAPRSRSSAGGASSGRRGSGKKARSH